MNDVASTLIRRQQAVQTTVDHFQGQPLVYGRTDCARMVAFMMKRLGLKVSLLKAGAYGSELGAAKALRRTGFASLPEAVDAHGLPRIAPAMAVVGDILALPAERFGGALMIAVGNGRVFGYFEGSFQVGQPHLFEAAWRTVNG